MKNTIIGIAAILRSPNPAYNLGIGYKGGLLIRCREDMLYFMETTKSGVNPATIMGRKTFESIPKKFRPFTDRTTIVVTSNPIELMSAYPGIYAFRNTEEAIAWAKTYHETIYICGGGEVYKALLKECQFLHLTEIAGEYPSDTFFPEFKDQFVFKKKIKDILSDDKTQRFEINLYERAA